MELFKIYALWWIYITTATWIAFFGGYYIKNRSSGDSELGRTFEFIFRYSLDMPCNWFLTFFPFFDLPTSYSELVTDRLKRYKKLYQVPFEERTQIQQYREWLAIPMCTILSKADKNHC